MEIRGKVALVTGGARRVGREIVLSLAREGARIGLHYNTSRDEAEKTKHAAEEHGTEVFLLQGDFSRIDVVQDVVEKCHRHWGQLDILINNASVYYSTPLDAVSEEQWDDLLSINLKAPFFCARAAARMMKNAGKIINIADVSGYIPWSDFIPYCTSKAGLIAVTKGLAKALAPDIQVNAVAPGTVLLGDDALETHAQEIERETLLKRIGSPQDIANTVIFLLKGSDYITGETIAVDGGSLLV